MLNNKKGATQLVWVILAIGLVLVGVLWFNKYINSPSTLTVTGPTGTQVASGQDVGSGKLTATMAFTTDEKYAIATQPACQNSLYIKDRLTGQYERVRNDLTEGATKAVTPGDIVTVYYCSNETAATQKGWYGAVDRDVLIGNIGSYEAHQETCQWNNNTLSTTVTNVGGGSTNPGTVQAIGSGGSALFHVTSIVPGNVCFSSPVTGAWINPVIRYGANFYQEITLKNVKINRNSGSGAGSVNLGTVYAGSGQMPRQSKWALRRSNDTAAAYKIPGYLSNGDSLEYDVFVQAVSGVNPTTQSADSSNINVTYFDTDLYPDTYSGAISGPAIEDNTGSDVGDNVFSQYGIGIS